MKINWKFWKRRREEPTKKQQAIPASWMRYMLKVLPDPNEFYIKGEAPTNRIFYGEPDDVPIAGQAVISPHPRVESFVRGKAVVFVFSEFRREIEVPIVKSIERVSYGSLDTEVETYLWDFSGLRVISDMGLPQFVDTYKTKVIGKLTTCLREKTQKVKYHQLCREKKELV